MPQSVHFCYHHLVFSTKKILLLLLLVLPGITTRGRGKTATAKSSFQAFSMKPGPLPTPLDFNGDQLEDLAVIQNNELTIILQDPKKGFAAKTNPLHFPLPDGGLLWPIRLPPNPAQQLILMNKNGLFRLHHDPPGKISQTPLNSRNKNSRSPQFSAATAAFFPLALSRTGKTPLLLLPADKPQGLWLWQQNQNDKWTAIQKIKGGVERRDQGPTPDALSRQNYRWRVEIQDINHDGLDDLVLRRQLFRPSRKEITVYLQQPNAPYLRKVARTELLPLPDTAPRFVGDDPWPRFDHARIRDLNHDGTPDLLLTRGIRQAWLIPGTYLPKIVVRLFLSFPPHPDQASPNAVFRKDDWTPWIPLEDFDHDGFDDLLLGFNRFITRDEVVRAFKTKKIGLNLRFYFGSAAKKSFQLLPGAENQVNLALKKFNLSYDLARFSQLIPSLLCFAGDFNGDGKKDLLIRDRNDGLSIYPFRDRTHGFSSRALFHLPLPNVLRISVCDLNHDGVSDILVKGVKSNRILLSRRQEKRP